MGWVGWVDGGGGGPHTIRRAGAAVLGQKKGTKPPGLDLGHAI
jgi:hypothetical protein